MNITYRPVSTLLLISKIIFKEASLSGSLRVLIPASVASNHTLTLISS